MTIDPLIGQQFANFRIVRVLGRGGMGLVYFGEDLKLGRPVAIKVIDTRYRGNDSYAQRFIREARAVASWRHTNIIQIHYADDQDGLYYFVMEYVDGQDLGQLINRYVSERRLMPHGEVLQIGRAVAGALDYAHQKGVIHRDIKPSNVMVAADGRIVLMDFGLALAVHQGSEGDVFGSSHYVAPEQARRSADAVPQSDLYALGVILYEMLTGILPFDDPSPTSVALQHITMTPPPPRQVNPNLSPAVEAVLLKALAKTPAERYQSGAELIGALEAAMLGQTAAPVTRRLSLSEESLIGQQLDEYRIEALLGRGGMAQIYRALDVRLNRYVAIKVIDPPLRKEKDYAERFNREAQAIAQLDHPNIVRLYRYGDTHGPLYIVMQYIEGANLDFVLSSFRKDGELIPFDQALGILRALCSALDYAHSRGVIHRDIKPSNIMIDPAGQPILTDFGLALLTTVGTQGNIFGSPHYIAPEQAISSARVVPQSDLYAVGVIIYQMITGQLPFDAEDVMDVAMMHLTEEPRPPRSIRPEISKALEAVVLKALAKEPGARYPSGGELAAALAAAVAAGELSASRPGLPSIPQRVAARLADQTGPPPSRAPKHEQAAELQPAAPPEHAPSAHIAAPRPAAQPAPPRQVAGRPEQAQATGKGQAATSPPPAQRRAPVQQREQIAKTAKMNVVPRAPAAQAARPPRRRRRGCLWTSLLLLTLLMAGGVGVGMGLVPLNIPLDQLPASIASYMPASLSAPATATTAATESTPGPLPTVTAIAASPAVSATLTISPTADTVVAISPTLAISATPGLPGSGAITETAAFSGTIFVPLLIHQPAEEGESQPLASLTIYKRDQDTLYLINSSQEPISLTRLAMRNSQGGISGSDLESSQLVPGACAVLSEPETYPLDQRDPGCLGRDVTVIDERDTHFWQRQFEVFVGDTLIGACGRDQVFCTFTFAQ